MVALRVSSAGALGESFSNESQLEIWAPDFLDKHEFDLGASGQSGSKGSVKDTARFNRIAWGLYRSQSMKMLFRGMENGDLALWDPAKILAGAGRNHLSFEIISTLDPYELSTSIPSNLVLSSGGIDGEVYIWDLKDPSKPYTPTPGSRSTKFDEITSSIVANDLADIVQNADLQEWQESLRRTFILFSKSSEEGMDSRTKGFGRVPNACDSTYLAAARLERLVGIWVEEMAEEEAAALADENVGSSFLELSALIKSCQTYLPFISFASLSMATDYSQYQLFLDRQFHLPYSDGGDVKLYVDFETHSQHLRDTAAQLSASPVMNHPFTSCEHHVALPSDSRALAVVENLRLLLRCIRTKQVSLYNDWCIALDKFPAMTERMLRSLMNEAGHVSDHKWTKVAPVSYSDFATLGVGRWLNDVVINYFVQKWCSREGTTLGLSTYFAGKFLFQGNSCTTAKTGTLTLADEERVVKSCRRTMKIRGLEFWDSVFIPINENSSHWYSAYIDFRLKRIEIYDSLQGTCLANRRKPVLLRKNANLMLVRLQIV
ncbi:hypothetical protein D9757_015430 [Collybiopsis confluens]|uniref:Protein transport protein SEC31 n=1 Tax=Collybiopsis confluens TaxID=2823264 RepID=A0A8H5FH58_9AGAR|nr:hypothetical protein D9757_015430 [Collybiopsis confluens]